MTWCCGKVFNSSCCDFEVSEDNQNSASMDAWVDSEYFGVVTKTILLTPIALTAIIANFALICFGFANKKSRNPMNIFIVNMAIADFFISLVFPWLILITAYNDGIFVFGWFVCKSSGVALVSLMLISVLSLTVVSYERLTVLLFPNKKRMSYFIARAIVLAIWLLAILTSSPMVQWRVYKEVPSLPRSDNMSSKGLMICTEHHDFEPLYYLLPATFTWLPLTLLSVVLTYVVFKMERLESQMCEHMARKLFRGKFVRMLHIVVLSFTLCWIPMTIVLIWQNHYLHTNFEIQKVPKWLNPIWFICYVLVFTNCALNPLIYLVKNENFKERLLYRMPCFAKQGYFCNVAKKTQNVSTKTRDSCESVVKENIVSFISLRDA